MAQQQQQADAQMQQQQLQQQIELSRENREDVQNSEIEKIQVKTAGQIEIDNNKIKGDLYKTQLKADNDRI
jgi:hypothetical protein